MIEFHRAALCSRAVNLEQKLGLDNLPELSLKAVRATALNTAFRRAVAECEFMQTTYKFRPATENDNVVVGEVLVRPDIVFVGSSGDNGVGIVVPTPKFNFFKPLQSFPHVVRSLKILSAVFGVQASALWVCRDTFDVRLDTLEPGDYSKEVEVMLASCTSHKVPDPPWKPTTAFDYEKGEIVYKMPNWPCGYCRVREECERRLYEEGHCRER